MSLNQLLAHAEGLVRDVEVGCGFEGCIMTLEDAIYESCDEEIICFRCEDKSLVDPKEACKMHDDTNHLNLVIVALAQTASWYADKGRKAMIKGKALLYTDAFGAQIFPCVITQALQLHNYVKSMSQNMLGDLVSDPLAGQFSKMVNLLTDHLKDAAKSEQVNKTKGDVKNQLLANLITSNRAENAKLLRSNKRKRNEHRIDPVAFKRTKLDEGVGSRRTFTTSQEWFAGDLSGLKSCFNDWITSCPIYKGNLTTAVQDRWVLSLIHI